MADCSIKVCNTDLFQCMAFIAIRIQQSIDGDTETQEKLANPAAAWGNKLPVKGYRHQDS